MCENTREGTSPGAAPLALGQGRPKICVPITAPLLDQLEEEAKLAAQLPADLYEFRIDHYREDVPQALKCLSRLLPHPILLTLRTKSQGGELELTHEEYERWLMDLIEAGGKGFKLIDIEISCGETAVRRLVSAAHKHGLIAVISHHDFQHTPRQSEMLALLRQMKSLGADLPKLAVMPSTAEDVLALMAATLIASREIGPIATMSMGQLGKVSRLCGELTGSAMTFAAGARPSAPGQLPAELMLEILNNLN